MRILHCLGWVASGGVEQLRLLMAQHLSGDDFEHHIICQEVSGGLPEQLADLACSIGLVLPRTKVVRDRARLGDIDKERASRRFSAEHPIAKVHDLDKDLIDSKIRPDGSRISFARTNPIEAPHRKPISSKDGNRL